MHSWFFEISSCFLGDISLNKMCIFAELSLISTSLVTHLHRGRPSRLHHFWWVLIQRFFIFRFLRFIWIFLVTECDPLGMLSSVSRQSFISSVCTTLRCRWSSSGILKILVTGIQQVVYLKFTNMKPDKVVQRWCLEKEGHINRFSRIRSPRTRRSWCTKDCY